jgi:hypothetical protein
MDLVYYGIGIMVLSVLGALYLLLSQKLMTVATSILPLAGILGYLMIFIGPLLCLSVPETSGTRGLLVAAAVGATGNLIFSGLQYLDPGYLTDSLVQFLKLAGVVGLILFVLFMKQLTRFVCRPDLTLKVNVLLATTVLFLLGPQLMDLLGDSALFESRSLVVYVLVMLTLVVYTYVLGCLKEALVAEVQC